MVPQFPHRYRKPDCVAGCPAAPTRHPRVAIALRLSLLRLVPPRPSPIPLSRLLAWCPGLFYGFILPCPERSIAVHCPVFIVPVLIIGFAGLARCSSCSMLVLRDARLTRCSSYLLFDLRVSRCPSGSSVGFRRVFSLFFFNFYALSYASLLMPLYLLPSFAVASPSLV